MKIMVIGGAGYVGSVLIPRLLENGHEVICVDSFFFGPEPIKDFKSDVIVVYSDIRNGLFKQFYKGVDTVVNLAAISQPDELERLDPNLFYEINYEAAVGIAKQAKKYGVKRHIYTSTCSVYGAQEGVLSEEVSPKPIEAYGKSKLMAEKEILELADNDFSVTAIRPGTMYGLSPKMRFDLVVNAMTWTLWKFGKINVMRPGTQWRPNVHVGDVSRAILKIIEADECIINKQIYNIGVTEQNYQIRNLAEEIGREVSNDYAIEMYGEGDRRSYNVSFEKLRGDLGFRPKYDVPYAAREVYDALETRETSKTTKTLVISWYEQLVAESKVKLLNL